MKLESVKRVIRCTSMEESRDFYTRVLGLDILQEWQDEQGRGCVWRLGNALLEAYEMSPRNTRFEDAFSQPFTNDKCEVQIATDSVDDWAERLTQLWPFTGPEARPWGQRWIQLRDPDNLPVAIYEDSFNKLEQQVQQMVLLQETVKKVNSILDLDQLLDEIVGSVAQTFGCNRTAVLLKDDAAGELEMVAVRGFSDLHLKGFRFKIGGEGIVGHVGVTHKMRYAPDVQVDPYYVTSEASTLSEVDIPLISRGKFIGIFNAQSSMLDAFSQGQIEILSALADNIAIAVENARLFQQERLEKEKAQREQAEARRIQRALLPDTDPVVPGYGIDGVCLQLSAVGGDWYDYLELPDGRWGIALGDVCGKGTAAALLMAATRSLFRRVAASGESPADVLTKLNESLLKDLPEGRFVTMLYLVLDPATGKLIAASAGHPYPYIMRESGPAALETPQGFPLGLLPCQYSEVETNLQLGEAALIYSDGVAEACTPDGEEYGEARLAEALRAAKLSAKALLADVQDFTRGGELSDDATAVVVRRLATVK